MVSAGEAEASAAGEQLAPVVYTALGEEAVDLAAAEGWKLLPLQTVREWMRDAMTQRQEPLSEQVKFGLEQILEWCDPQ
jgi:hypothetical protein